MKSIIWWLRRDIRLDDNTALAAALRASGGAVVPVFILDPQILAASDIGAARVHFLMESLRELDQQLRARGARLIVRRGDPAQELIFLARESAATAVFFNRDYEPYARARDQRVADALESSGVCCESFKDRLIIEPDELLASGDKPYTVYTPYRRRWLALLGSDESRSAQRNSLESVQFRPLNDSWTSLPIPTAAELGFELTQTTIPPGEQAAQRLLRDFARRDARGLRDYHLNRNRLGVEGTSRLAPHLRHGTLSPRAPVRAALALRAQSADPETRRACETWLGELAWRDFYTGIMYHFPHVLERPYRDLFINFPYRDAPDELTAWKQGRTGYPIVDAAMRQLNREGFMHNRARMIVASFLIKDLLIDYRAGERYFLQMLACGDAAVNNGNWQWVAGSSNDPQPYFRVFNPLTQARTYDPDGAYVRRYLPELDVVPDAYLHAPWTMPQNIADEIGFKLGRDYPHPLVDHNMARARALAAFRTHRARFNADTPEPRKCAQEHG